MYSNAIIIKSEQAVDLKEGLIVLTSAMRHPGPISITTDCAPGFQSLARGDDQQLAQLKITIVTRDKFNRNFNAVVDHACRELENEIRKLAPEGGPITQAQLTQAIVSLNSVVRRKGKLSAYKIHTARSSTTGTNIRLNDKHLRSEQIQSRRAQQESPVTAVQIPKPGDTVTNV